MTRAYPKYYLDAAMENLGNYFEYGVIGCHIDADDLAQLFIQSYLARPFSMGLVRYNVGTTGRGLLCRAFRAVNRPTDSIPFFNKIAISPFYWAGMSVAYYQWYRNTTLENIWQAVPMSRIVQVYYPLHEAGLSKFVDVMDSLLQPSENAVG